MNKPPRQIANSPLAHQVCALIASALPDADITVDDPDGAHLSAVVVCGQFSGLSKLQQHKLVYAALGDAFDDRLHALQLTTRAC